MEIVKADKSHKSDVLRLLDEFRTAISSTKNFISTTAKDNGGDLFDSVIGSPNTAIFLAKEGNKYRELDT